jgi:hypothetical protein
VVRSTFSPARAWRPVVVVRLARTLGVTLGTAVDLSHHESDKMPKRPKVHEGTLALVPLQPTGFALCVVARSSGTGRAFGYFFGPAIADASSWSGEVPSPDRAVLVCRFGDHGLWHGDWPQIGQVSPWHRSAWPLPKLARKHDDPTLMYVTEYDDSLNVLSEQLIPKEQALACTSLEDSQLGSGIVESKLSQLLASQQTTLPSAARSDA